MKNKQDALILAVITLLIIIMLTAVTDSAFAEEDEKIKPVFTTAVDDTLETAKLLYGWIINECPNEVTAAAIIAMFYRESQFQSDAHGGWQYINGRCQKDESLIDMRLRLCREWTEQIDEGLADRSTEETFIRLTNNRTGGYGLAQWLGDDFLSLLYVYAHGYGTSLGDARMQCAFTLFSMKTQTPKLWKALGEQTDPYQAGLLVAKFYEGTVNPDSTASFAIYFYNKLKEEEEPNE